MLIHLVLVVTLKSVLFCCATNKDIEAKGISWTCPSPRSPYQKELELGFEPRHPGTETCSTLMICTCPWTTSLRREHVHSQKLVVSFKYQEL